VKLSAYVPDELWARVQARFPGSRPSPVAQLALRRMVERSRPRFALTPSAPAAAALPLRRARVSELRQRAYEEGYVAGLVLCESLSWPDLERLAAADWPVEGGATAGARQGSLAHRAGTRDAMRDVWLAVVQTQQA
jgi:hypothetical protein